MHCFRSILAVVAFAVALPRPAPGDDDPPLAKRIDEFVAAATPGYRQHAAPTGGDAEFLRRVYLDLHGTIPTAAAARRFLDDRKPKRRRLIDELLAGPHFARRMQEVFDAAWMQRLPQQHVPPAEWRRFLRESFAQNRPFDLIVRDVLSADGVDTKSRGPARFYLDRGGDTTAIARQIGRVFLGADLECAQCHNHPEIDEWKQRHYFGLSAFLVRSFVFNDRKQKRSVYAEKAVGEVSFESVFDIRDKKSPGPQSTPPQLFDGPLVAEPAFAKGREYVVKPKKNVRPVPRYSRRRQLAALLTARSNRRFARTTANRLWALLMGRGLVHPLDRDHPGNPPSHPKLLDALTDELIARNFDVKWFIRELVLSQTYQRASAPRGSKTPQTDATRYSHALLKPLSAEQFARAVLQATGEIDVVRASLGAKATDAALEKKLAPRIDKYIQIYGGRPGETPDGFQSSVKQSLFLANDSLIADVLKRKPGNLLDRLLKLNAEEPGPIVETAYLTVLTRRSTETEGRIVADYIRGKRGVDREAAMRDVIWAMLNTAEFRFNH